MRISIITLFLFLSFCATAQNFYLFIGTYTNKGSKGIYVYRFNAATGTAEWVSNTDSSQSPSYLAVAPNEKYVYAVNETHGENGGKVSAYTFDKASGKLTFVNQQSTGGDDPCYVTVGKNNKWVIVGNYSGGSAAAFAANTDGSLQPYSQLLQDSGSSANTTRQEKAHLHSTVFSPNQDYLFTPDLGIDKVKIYKFNPDSQQPLTPATPPYVSVSAGNGPRHFTFHPNQKFAYLIQELSGTVGVFKYNNGKLTLLEDVPTHPAGYKGDIGSADIHVSPDGKFLYASNRGDENNITIFSINPQTGRLKLKGYQSTLGKTPRNFIIDPTGNYLLVANQDTDNVVIFKRNKQTGLLKATGKQIEVSMPVCLQLLKQGE
ncbi:lactonase family protein [Segetibacter koreensis]|uniref:lactonase family protein n=1 Tax=Segetibacter koreensis TaxID=398037 RepID=UPI00036EFE35|nr:lactonase family protein [Segetibacter koreensis]